MDPDTDAPELDALQAHAERRRARAVLPWIEESAQGYALVAERSRDSGFAEFAAAAHRERRRWAEALGDALTRAPRPLLPRLLGRMHRAWMRLVASAGDAGLLDELERGDAALERKIRRALRHGHRSSSARRLNDFLLATRAAVAADRDALVRLRPRLEWASESASRD
jgi:hypothetical protein